MKGKPVTRDRGIKRREEIGNDGRNGFVAFGFYADVAYKRGELGADTNEMGPASWVIFELKEDVENNVVREL